MTRKSLHWALVLLSALIPAIVLLYLYPQLPDRVPTHYNIQGKADGYDQKSFLWFPVLLITGISIGLNLLFQYLPSIDPKANKTQSLQTLQKIGLGVSFFFCVILLGVVLSAKGDTHFMDKTFVPAMGLLFAFLGNNMHSLKPNYFVGFRLPWTLENEQNWRQTHQMVSKYWVAGGICIFLCGLFTSMFAGIIILFITLVVIIVLPTIYSYRLFKKGNPSA